MKNIIFLILLTVTMVTHSQAEVKLPEVLIEKFGGFAEAQGRCRRIGKGWSCRGLDDKEVEYSDDGSIIE
jgi:hypothetical protein